MWIRARRSADFYCFHDMGPNECDEKGSDMHYVLIAQSLVEICHQEIAKLDVHNFQLFGLCVTQNDP